MSEQLRSYSQVPVRARVGAATAKAALDHLTDVASPLVVMVAVEGDVLTFTTHAEPEPWWATVTVRVMERWPEEVNAEVVVPRMPLVEAVEMEAQLNPDVDCVVTILHHELLRYGTGALGASTDAAFTPRPRPGSAHVLRRGLALPELRVDGSAALEVGGLLLHISAPLNERFGLRAIPTVDVYDDDGTYLVMGHTGEANAGDHVTLTGVVSPL